MVTAKDKRGNAATDQAHVFAVTLSDSEVQLQLKEKDNGDHSLVTKTNRYKEYTNFKFFQELLEPSMSK
jgi:hypothetical protein